MLRKPVHLLSKFLASNQVLTEAKTTVFIHTVSITPYAILLQYICMELDLVPKYMDRLGWMYQTTKQNKMKLINITSCIYGNGFVLTTYIFAKIDSNWQNMFISPYWRRYVFFTHQINQIFKDKCALLYVSVKQVISTSCFVIIALRSQWRYFKSEFCHKTFPCGYDGCRMWCMKNSNHPVLITQLVWSNYV